MYDWDTTFRKGFARILPNRGTDENPIPYYPEDHPVHMHAVSDAALRSGMGYFGAGPWEGHGSGPGVEGTFQGPDPALGFSPIDEAFIRFLNRNPKAGIEVRTMEWTPPAGKVPAGYMDGGFRWNNNGLLENEPRNRPYRYPESGTPEVGAQTLPYRPPVPGSPAETGFSSLSGPDSQACGTALIPSPAPFRRGLFPHRLPKAAKTARTTRGGIRDRNISIRAGNRRGDRT